MRIEVSDGRIEGFCVYGISPNERSVITFTRWPDSNEWSTASSMCIPGKTEEAEEVITCYAAAMAALIDQQKEEAKS